MKKILALVLALMMVLCSAAALAEAGEDALYLGIGSVTTLGHSTQDATADANGSVQPQTTYISAVVDANGVIQVVAIDCAQNTFAFTAEGKLALNEADTYPTKIEKKEAYAMKGASAIGLEWYEQIAGLEDWLVGKTVDELKAAVEAKDETLLAAASIDLSDIVGALEKAVADALGK